MPNTSPKLEKLGFLTVINQPRLGLIGGYLILNQTGRPLEFHCTNPLKPNRTQEVLYGNTLAPFLYGEQIARTLLIRSKTPVSYILTNIAAVLAVQEHVETPVFYVFETGKKRELPEQPIQQECIQQECIQQENIQQENFPQENRVEKPTNNVLPLFPEFSVPQTTLEISEELNESLKSFGIENTHLQPTSNNKEEQFRIPEVPGLNLEHWKEVKIGNRFLAIPMLNETEHHPVIDNIKRFSRTIDFAEPFTRIRLAIEETLRAA